VPRDSNQYGGNPDRYRSRDVANQYLHSDGRAIKSLLNIVVFVVVLIWVLQTFGLIGAIPGLKNSTA
jgi:hypothetical protein